MLLSKRSSVPTSPMRSVRSPAVSQRRPGDSLVLSVRFWRSQLMRTRYLSAAVAALGLALGIALAAPPSSAVTGTYTIQDLQNPAAPNPGATDTVITSGVITAVDIRPTGLGFYIQDQAGGQYSGILVFTG